MARGLAFVQFLTICLGVFALHLLGKLHHEDKSPEAIANLAHFLGRYALWLLVVPILWAVVGNAMKGRFGDRATNIVGGVLTVGVVLVFAVPLIWYLS